MNKNWNETIIAIIGVLLTDDNGLIDFKSNQFGKYTATMKVAENSRWNILQRKNTFVFIDGLREADVKVLKEMEADGEISGKTKLKIIGHLVRTPGKPGMNDLFNLKTMSINPAMDDEVSEVNFDEALTKEEWRTILNEKFIQTIPAAPVAPTAPVAPSAPV